MSEKFYLTTAIPYVNASMHLGHSYEMIATDALARWQRRAGYDVYFLTGTDENSQNTEKKARELGLDPQIYCDQMAEEIKALWQTLEISFDGFIRTTSERHKRSAQEFFNRVYENGDIYKDTYKGWYCVSCEGFKTEEDLIDGKCPNHGVEPEWLEEENYFFALSKYQEPLLEYIAANPDFIQPEGRKNEVVSFIQQGLRDFSVSRAQTKWGILTPIDQNHSIYIWFDALLNYISGIGYPDDKKMFERYWPCDIHIIGKDIIRFHCVYWPAMLMSAGLPLPKRVFGHGWVLVEGEKMSKTRGIYVDPKAAVAEYGADAIRYFLLREIPFDRDGNFSEDRFVSRYNADLANDFGNLLNRTLTLVKKNGGVIPTPAEAGEYDDELKKMALETYPKVDELVNQLAFDEALETIWQLVRRTNQYLSQTAPWLLAKEEAKRPRLNTVLYNCLEALRFVGLLISPFIPKSAERMFTQMGLGEEFSAAPFATLTEWGKIPAGIPVGEFEPLFPRIDKPASEISVQPKEELQPPISSETITFEDFNKLDLRVAKVNSAERIEGTDKLLTLQVSIGPEKRTIVAGIGNLYKPEEMIGKLLIVVVNLKPAKIRGVLSEGMLLAASLKEDLVLVTTEGEIDTGAKVV